MGGELKRYFASGRTGSLGTARVLALGLLGSSALGAGYAYVLLYNPFVSIGPLFMIFLGGLSGFITGLGGDMGHVRHPRKMFWLGALLGLVFIYVSWVIWFRATSNHQVLSFLPWDMAKLFSRILETGSWEILGWKPQGNSLFYIWVLEALSASLVSGVMAWGVNCRSPYCEHCSHWVEESEELCLLEPLPGIETLREKLEKGDLGAIFRLSPVADDSRNFLRITLNHCPDCKSFHLMSLHSLTALKNAKGKNIREDEVWENLLISRKDFETLRGKWGLKTC